MTRSPVLLIASCVWLLSVPAGAQYVVRSAYLNDPGLAIGYVDSCARLWTGAYDSVRGGFYTNVDNTGHVLTAWGTNKDLLSQSRDAYGFTRAFMLTGNESYLTMARHALDFQYAHAWDNVWGGWYTGLDVNGKPDSAAVKTAFYQHYALLGPGAYFEATRDTTEWTWLMKGYAVNESKLWDSSAASRGYYDAANRNWTGRTNKSFNATVDAITTHVLPLYLLTQSEPYRSRLLELAAEMRDRLVPTMDSHVIGFVEMFDTNWGWTDATGGDQYHNRTIMGHVLKTGWCFARIEQILADTTYVPAAEKLVTSVWQKGYDHVYGGPFKDYDRTNGTMFMYGQDTAKAWWQMEQAVVAGLMLYNLTGSSVYLQMADETLLFYMAYFVDHVYGDVYSDVAHDGAGWLWNNAKGSSGKAAYHSTETGYYVYLYGKLLLKGEPATLHYKIAPRAVSQDVALNPIALASSKYRISNVALNAAPYADFDGVNRVLHIPAGTGGHFVVTFAPAPAASVATAGLVPSRFELAQNFPNPFNPRTTIRYSIHVETHVHLGVYDLLGREVATLVDTRQAPGRYDVGFDGSRLASGMYVYHLTAGAFSSAKKLVLVR